MEILGWSNIWAPWKREHETAEVLAEKPESNQKPSGENL